MYWCENCNKHFKSIDSLVKHFRLDHEINVRPRRDCYTTEWNKRTADFKCAICGQLIQVSRQKSALYEPIATHLRSHGKYWCDGQEIKGKTDLLRYIDKKYGLHSGYKIGLTTKKVFLDGIGK